MYALDTNTLIYFFRGMGRVSERLLAVPPSSVAVPSVVVYELEVGIAKSSSPEKRRGQLDRVLTLVTVLPFDEGAARLAGRIRAVLERQGVPIGPHDVLIAATALAADAILVTHNTSEFGRIADLRMEDWY